MNLMEQVYGEKKQRSILMVLFIISISLLSACDEPSALNKPALSNYTTQGKAYLAQHQFKAAITAAKQAIKAYPENIDGYLVLAEIYQQLQQPELTIDVLQAYNNEKSSEYYFLLLSAYQDSGQLQDAHQLISQQTVVLGEQPARFTLHKAQLHLLAKELESATSLFQSLEHNAVYTTDALLGKARILIASNKTNDALSLLDEIMTSSPSNSEAILLKSELLKDKKAFADAEELLSDGLSVIASSDMFTPQRIDFLTLLTEVLTAQGRSSEALFYSRLLAKENPDNVLVQQYYQRAIVHYEAARYLDAKSALDKILIISPANQEALTLFAIVLYQQGEVDEAQKYIASIGHATGKLSSFDDGKPFLLRDPAGITNFLISRINTEQPFEMLSLYLFASIQNKQFGEAKKVLTMIVNSDSESPASLQLQAYYHANIATPDQQHALQILEKAVNSFDNDAQLKAAYIGKLLELQRNVEADLVVAELVKTASNNVEKLLLIANYQLFNQKYLLANQYFEQVLSISEENESALYGLAKSFQSQKEFSKALKVYQALITLEPQQFLAYQGCVDSFFQLSKNAEKLQAILPEKHDPALLALALVGVQVEQYKLQTAGEQLQIALSGAPAYLMPHAKELKLKKDYQQAKQATASSDFVRARSIILNNIKTSPSSEGLLLLLSKVEIKSENYNEAKKVLIQVEGVLPNNASVDIAQADLELALEHPEQAIKFLKERWQLNHNEQIALKIYQLLDGIDPIQASNFLKQWQTEMPNSQEAKRQQT